MLDDADIWKKKKVIADLAENRSHEKINVEADGPHEEINIGQTLAGHRGRQSLREVDSLHDTVLDGHDKALLLLRAGADADGSQELPYVYILASVDRAGEDIGESPFNNVKECVISREPTDVSKSKANTWKWNKTYQ